jgi:tripartite-type tricarboxylate transporter receptor subunit TctC
MNRRSVLSNAIRVILLMGTAGTGILTQAADYPVRPVHIVVAYPPGSTMDVLARLLAADLQTIMGGTFIVENRPGAAGQIGAEFVARAPADGYTLFISGSSTHSANPALFKKLRYDPVRDFTPIVHIASLTYALVVNADTPVKSLSELAQYANTQPKGLAYAYGSQLGQIAGASISKLSGMKTIGVPYKGQPPALTDLIGGQVQFLVADIPVILPHIKSGKLRAIAVLNDLRSPLLPEVPTLAEQGYKGYDLVGWVGLSGPANTPPAVVNMLATASTKALSNPTLRNRLSNMGMEFSLNSPAQFGALVANQIGVWSKKARDAGIDAE